MYPSGCTLRSPWTKISSSPMPLRIFTTRCRSALPFPMVNSTASPMCNLVCLNGATDTISPSLIKGCMLTPFTLKRILFPALNNSELKIPNSSESHVKNLSDITRLILTPIGHNGTYNTTNLAIFGNLLSKRLPARRPATFFLAIKPSLDNHR